MSDTLTPEAARALVERLDGALAPYEQHMAARLAPDGTAPYAEAVSAAAAVLSALVGLATLWQTKRQLDRSMDAAAGVPDFRDIREQVLRGKMSINDAERELLRFSPDDLSDFQRELLAESSTRREVEALLDTLGIPSRLLDHVIGDLAEAAADPPEGATE